MTQTNKNKNGKPNKEKAKQNNKWNAKKNEFNERNSQSKAKGAPSQKVSKENSFEKSHKKLK